jgi:mono/diheme cytochrome c family protein
LKLAKWTAAIVLSASAFACFADGGPVPTYNTDVAPILGAKCVQCHTTGGIAPFPLETYADAVAHATEIRSAVTSGIMPPWPPSDTCTSYKYDRSLTAAQIQAISDWVAGGTPQGLPNATPNPVESSVATLSRTDLTLAMPASYTPVLTPDEYRCFLVDWPQTTTSFVTGMGIKPGDGAIVHHAIVFLAKPNQIATYQNLDAQDSAPGWPCFGGPGGDVSSAGFGWVGAWVPGAVGADFPAGTGIEIPPGSKLVLQMHYNTASSPPAPDQTTILLKVDPTVDKPAAVIPFADPNWLTVKNAMNIPAHDADAMHQFAFDLSPYLDQLTDDVLAANQPFTIYSAALHMHTHGTHAITQILRGSADPDECMLDIHDWDFHWQGTYPFSTPKVVNPGDKISLECHWNNPGDTELNWGETTEDEMCLGVYYATR